MPVHPNKLLINSPRFKVGLSQKDYDSDNFDSNVIFQYPIISKNYYNFFNHYAKQNYKLSATTCLCKSDNDILLSKVDRCGVNFDTVVCKDCGLIRAKEYFTNENVSDFYTNYYRDVMKSEGHHVDPQIFYDTQAKNGIEKFKIINKYGNIKLDDSIKVVDIGGGAGGVLENFKPSTNLFLADYFEPYLNIANKNNINIISGGLQQIEFKPDVIILSHVIEHWNQFEREIENLISIQKLNQTLNYIEFPGIDSLKDGRRDGDFLGDIHIPHVYYFASYVFENIMGRYGFKKLYLDSTIRSLFVYTGQKIELENYFDKVHHDLILAEKKRKIIGCKKFIRNILPKKFLDILIKFK